MSLAGSECEHSWRQLRGDNNWQDFAPKLQRVFERVREEAQALNAAQLHQAMVNTIPDAGDRVARLDLEPIFDWLSQNVWQKGSLLDYDDLMVEATGETLNPEHFLRHVRERYC